jgi:hypothetical protein
MYIRQTKIKILNKEYHIIRSSFSVPFATDKK